MKIKAISISDRKGMRKANISKGTLVQDFGLENDAHGGKWHRQISLLAEESIQFMREKGLDVVAGNFAENITTEGIDLLTLSVGDHIKLGNTEIVISQLGKICHNRCAIYHQAGDCVMPREGIFGVIVHGGDIAVGDQIEVLTKKSESAALVYPITSDDAEIDVLEKQILSQFKPGFVRHDPVKSDLSNLAPILKDLSTNQKVNWIVIYDPNTDLILNKSLFGEIRTENTYNLEGSTLLYTQHISSFEVA